MVPRAIGLLVVALCVWVGCVRYQHREPECPPAPTAPKVVPFASTSSDSVPKIQGRIVEAESGAGVGRAILHWTLGSDTVRVLSDTVGNFEIARVEPGEGTLSVAALGYQTRADALRIERHTSLDLTVPLEFAVLDGCPGFMVERARKPWWKWW
jgi:hypothetical protein